MKRDLRLSTLVLTSTLVGCVAEVDGLCEDPSNCLGTIHSEVLSELHRKKHRFTITSTVDPSDSGIVTLEAANNRAACEDGMCRAARGGAVTLHAEPVALFGFDGWSGCSDSTDPTITLTNITASADCVAHFSPTTMIVSAFVVGMYRGTPLLSSDAGSCSTYTCSVPYGTVVTIRAPESPRYRFLSSGCSDGSSSTDPVFELTADGSTPTITCTVHMEPITVEVTWSVDPNAPGGSIVGDARGPDIVCSNTSCQVVLEGSVALQATPEAGHVFVGWSGCSTSSEPTLELRNVTEPLHCVARFGPEP